LKSKKGTKDMYLLWMYIAIKWHDLL
jgi:hypothetical protein